MINLKLGESVLLNLIFFFFMIFFLLFFLVLFLKGFVGIILFLIFEIVMFVVSRLLCICLKKEVVLCRLVWGFGNI